METNEKKPNVTEQNAASGGNSSEGPKTFSQDELNAIIADRLSREREKFADYDALKAKADKLDKIEEANKSELEKAQEELEKLKGEKAKLEHEREVAGIRAKISKETGVPADLITADTEEAAKAQAEAILKFKGESAGSSYSFNGDRGEGVPPETDFSKINDIKDARARVRALEQAIKSGADLSKLIK